MAAVDCPIAIIGVSARYAGAKNKQELCENHLGRGQQFRKLPPQRLPSEYVDPQDPDKSYCNEAAIIDGFELEPEKHHIPAKTAQVTDLVHWLALENAKAAIADAALSDLGPEVRARTRVIIGNTECGEETRANAMRFRLPFITRCLRQVLDPSSEDVIQRFEEEYMAPFPVPNEDSLAGGLANVIAGRIAGEFHFLGGAYTVDAACASSLLSVYEGCVCLASGDADVVVCGGVDSSIDPFELVGFSRIGALARNGMHVGGENANGFLPGEGCGIFVLASLATALKWDLKTYAVIRGWGMSSDGTTTVTTPSVKGQLLAIQRAFACAGISVSEARAFEAHGTGTRVGDEVEASALSAALSLAGSTKKVPFASMKSKIGHTKAAAGAAGLMSGVLMVSERVVPPVVGCGTPQRNLRNTAQGVYPATRAELLGEQDEKIIVGVQAMGFGGQNVHVVLESAPAQLEKKMFSPPHGATAISLASSLQDVEFCVFSADSQVILADQLDDLARKVEHMSKAEICDLAKHLAVENSTNTVGAIRAAMIVRSPSDLVSKLAECSAWLRHETARDDEIVTIKQEVYVCKVATPKRAGFLFGGQGQAGIGMGELLYKRFPQCRDIMDQADQLAREAGLSSPSDLVFRPTHHLPPASQERAWATELTQPCNVHVAVITVQLMYAAFLRHIGLEPSVVLGHSLGELSALHLWKPSSVCDTLRVAMLRGQAMQRAADTGAMAVLDANAATCEKLMKGIPDVHLANFNHDNQTVVSGTVAGISRLKMNAVIAGTRVTILEQIRVPCHTPLLQSAAAQFRTSLDHCGTQLSAQRAQQPAVRMISSRLGETLPDDCDLLDYLPAQMTDPVLFDTAFKATARLCDYFVEAGYGHVLSKLGNTIVGMQSCFPCEPPHADLGYGLCSLACNLFLRGAKVNYGVFFDGRLCRPLVWPEQRKFLSNPCERSVLSVVHRSTKGQMPVSDPQTDKLVEKHVAVEHSAKMEVPVEPYASDESSQSRSNEDAPTEKSEPTESGDDTPFAESQRAAVSQCTSSCHCCASRSTSTQCTGAATPAVAAAPASVAPHEVVPHDLESVEHLVLAQLREDTGFSEILPQHHLSEDLHLDSIKVEDVVVKVTSRLGLPSNRVEKSELKFGTVKKMVDLIYDAHVNFLGGAGDDSQNSQLALKLPNWTHAFEMAEEAADIGDSNDVRPQQVLLVHVGHSETDAHTLSQLVASMPGVNVEIISTMHLDMYSHDPASTVILLLPLAGNNDDAPAMVLHAYFVAWRALVHSTDSSFIAVQWAEDANNRSGDSLVTPIFHSSQAILASMQRERPSIRAKVVELNAEIPLEVCSGLLARELADAWSGFTSVQYKNASARTVRVPKHHCRRHSPRSHPPTPRDVVVAFGGAKGITSECLVACLAGRKVALVVAGRTKSDDDTVCEALQRYRDAGIECHYNECDIGDPEGVASLFRSVQQQLGAITVVVHGAGDNANISAVDCKPSDFGRVLSPKLNGALNICHALEAAPPRLIIALTSVIGMVGMDGNSIYAWANEVEEKIFRKFCSRHRECSLAALGYSVWDSPGMGVRMNVLDSLRRRGVTPLTIAEGVEWFTHAWDNELPAQLAITARIAGDLAQPFNARGVVSDLPFVSSVEQCIGDVEMVARCPLVCHGMDNDDDDNKVLSRALHLEHHAINGMVLAPLMVLCEAMAEAAFTVLQPRDGWRVTELRDVKALARVTLVEGRAEIALHAQVQEVADGYATVKCGVRSAESGFERDHVTCTVVVAKQSTEPEVRACDFPSAIPHLIPSANLYGSILFHGPHYQRIKSIRALSVNDDLTDGSVVFSVAAQTTACPFLLGDVIALDAMLQGAQLILPQEDSLPATLKMLCIHRPVRGNVDMVVSLKAQRSSPDVEEVDSHIEAIDHATGEVVYEGDFTSRRYRQMLDRPTADDLMHTENRDNALLTAAVQRIDGSFGVRFPAWLSIAYCGNMHTMDTTTRHEIQRTRLPEYLRSALDWDNGRPVLAGTEFGISVAHDDYALLISYGPGQQGVDVMPIESRLTEAQLRDVLAEHHRDAFEALRRHQRRSKEEAGCMVRAAREAAVKAQSGASVDHLLAVVLEQDETAALLRFGDAICCIVLRLNVTAGLPRVVACMVELRPEVWAKSIAGSEDGLALVPYEEMPSGNRVLVDKRSPNMYDLLAETTRLNRLYGPSLRRSHFASFPPSLFAVDCRAASFASNQPMFIIRLALTFEDAKTVSHHVPLVRFIRWMGFSREVSLWDAMHQLTSVPDTVLITNKIVVEMYGELTALDVVTVCNWQSHFSGQKESTSTLYFDFLRVVRHGLYERVGTGQLEFTLCRLGQTADDTQSHRYINDDDYFNLAIVAPSDTSQPGRGNPPPYPAIHGDLSLGAPLWEAAGTNRPGNAGKVLLMEQPLDTCQQDSNLVGNLYYANYCEWLVRAREHWMYELLPQCMRSESPAAPPKTGEFVAKDMSVKHLREGMPFDSLLTRIYLTAIYENGVGFFGQVLLVRRADKVFNPPLVLAVYNERLTFVVRHAFESPALAKPLPDNIRQLLLARTEDGGTAAHLVPEQ